MKEARPLNTGDAPAYPSPLWIIALFIGLSEATAGVAAIATAGTSRTIFAVFAVAFPVLVLALFIWLLLEHPGNLYSPWQYSGETSIEGYVAALRRENTTAAVVFSHAVGEAVASATSTDRALPGEDVRDRAARVFGETVDKSSITIDRSQLEDGAEPATIPVGSGTTVSELLDSIYLAIAPAVKPYTYNKSWVLARPDGVPLDAIGTRWARNQRMGWDRDHRPLDEAGIKPGSTFAVKRIR